MPDQMLLDLSRYRFQRANEMLAAEWEALEPERQITRAILEGQISHALTQKQLAEIKG